MLCAARPGPTALCRVAAKLARRSPSFDRRRTGSTWLSIRSIYRTKSPLGRWAPADSRSPGWCALHHVWERLKDTIYQLGVRRRDNFNSYAFETDNLLGSQVVLDVL